MTPETASDASSANHGSATPLFEDAPEDGKVPRDERELHDKFAAWLRVHEPSIPFIHARMDRKSTIREGWPDFTVLWRGMVVCVEFKMPDRKLTEDQYRVHGELTSAGIPCATCYSVVEAMAFVRGALGL